MIGIFPDDAAYGLMQRSTEVLDVIFSPMNNCRMSQRLDTESLELYETIITCCHYALALLISPAFLFFCNCNQTKQIFNT